LILDSCREQKLVNPWGLVVHIHKNPPLLGALPAAPEGSLDVFIPALTSQGKANPVKDGLGVSGRRVIIPEKVGIRRNSQLALT
jgi:hypothetical protein